jgi:hypothetical protein
MDKPEPQEQGARGSVLGIVAGKEGLEIENGKGIFDDSAGCFQCVALSPIPRRDVHAEFGCARLALAWPETAAADVVARLEQKDGPILDAVDLLGGDFLLQSSAHLLCREDTFGYEATDGGIAPQPEGEREI